MQKRLAVCRALGAALFAALAAGGAFAQIITPSTGTPELGSSSTFLVDAPNGNGIIGAIDSSPIHDSSFANNSYINQDQR